MFECGIEFFNYKFVWDDTFSYNIITSEESMQRMCKECEWEIEDTVTLKAKPIDSGFNEALKETFGTFALKPKQY